MTEELRDEEAEPVVHMPPPLESTGFDLRAWVKNSPWLAIAMLLHVIALAVTTVIYVAHGALEEKISATAVRMNDKALDLPPPIEEPVEIRERDMVPVLDNEIEGIVNPDPDYVPKAEPGMVGEITDETDPNKDAGIYNPDPLAPSNLLSGATGGTPIGVGPVGHHGTGTSAFVSRRPGSGGPGGGGRGQGGEGGPGGTRSEQAVFSALLWLQEHQSPDGRWDADGFSAMCKKNLCSGEGHGSHDAGLTGLALLCFLGAGYTHEGGRFKDTVRNGLKFLKSIQDEEGCFGERVGQHYLYNHACAALAMAEAYGMTQAKPFREPAQKGIIFVHKSQNPYSAWRYTYPANGENDTSVSGWMVMVLKSGIMSGLTVDEGSFASAMTWVDEVTDPVTGRTGYSSTGGYPSRLAQVEAEFPADKSESMTAVGVLIRIFSGHTMESDPLISKGADLMAERLPVWADGGDIDFYYWYYGTLAMHQVGGPRWDKWNAAIKTAILDHQRNNEDEDEYGSWDPVDPWASAGGRIYATTLNCLSMEVYYRYPRVFGTAKKETAKEPAKPK